MKAYGKNIRISPKKLLVIAEVIKGKKVTEALKFLKFAPKKGADLMYKIVHSAMKNAENNNAQNADTLFIGELIVTK
jgi:large subunit ribosomal protein L22